MIEALMTGIPTMSMGRETWWVPDLFEGPDLLPSTPYPEKATAQLALWLRDKEEARLVGEQQRRMAIELFGIETIAAQWADFLGAPVEKVASVA
jgi:glycosyltransferase involved in cell wall biosynthesis